MTQPADFDPETTPVITLDGREWPIPELVWADLKKCRRAILDLNDAVNSAVAAVRRDPDDSDAVRGARNLAAVGDVFRALGDDDYDRLVMGPILAGLQAAHPSLKRAELDGWPLGESDRQMAWLTVRRQSGLFVFAGDAATEEPGAGEANGAS